MIIKIFLGQILLLLLASSATKTTGGLETYFKRHSFWGIEMSATTALGLSVAWSLKSCIGLNLKLTKVTKVFLPTKATIMVLLWSLFGVMRRVLVIVAFFIPSLGLCDLLYHWKAEQIPFSIRLRFAQQRSISPDDAIVLHNMSEPVLWSQLDRWNYDDPNKPTPPPYSMYTLLSLTHTFIAFFVLLFIHCLCITILKIFTSPDFRGGSVLDQLTHVLQSLNIPAPYCDWDSAKTNKSGERLSVGCYKRRFKAVRWEMILSYMMNSFFTIIMLVPLMYTGE